jgi:putative ABC transport system permease protein
MNMEDSMNQYYQLQHTPDISLIKTDGDFTETDLQTIYQSDSIISRLVKVKLYEQKNGRNTTRFYLFDFAEFGLSPLSNGQALQDNHFIRNVPNQPTLDLTPIYWGTIRAALSNMRPEVSSMSDLELQQYISDQNLTESPMWDVLIKATGLQEFDAYTRALIIEGVYNNPLYLLKDDLVEFKETRVNQIFYLDSASLPEFVLHNLPTNELFLYLNHHEDKFTDSYEKDTLALKAKLEQINANYVVLTFMENETYQVFSKSANSIGVLSFVFPILFFLISLLVIISTMSKMVDKERLIIGTMKSLGFSNTRIRNKYILYVSVPALIGGVAGVLVGFRTFPLLIWTAYEGAFRLPPLVFGFYYFIALAAFAALIIIILLATLRSVNIVLKERPYLMLRPVSPKPGKRIPLERIPFFWNRLKFKTKSMYKNLFRYGKNSLLTIFGLAGATAMMFLGIGLKRSVDLLFDKGGHWLEFSLAGSNGILYGIVLVLISFSVILCALVIFSLINSTIDEREKEIATLRVLGYSHGEVIGYLYREKAILAVIGMGIGVGIGTLILRTIIGMMNDNGTPLTFSPHPLVFLFSLLLIAIFTVLIGGFMIFKINKVSMTNSLKAVE